MKSKLGGGQAGVFGHGRRWLLSHRSRALPPALAPAGAAD